MRNTRLKNVLVSAGVAVFAGVLLLGVNAAIGATTPSQEPPGTGVAPTFTGLNVTGNIENSGGNVSIADNVTVDGTLDVTGDVTVDTGGPLLGKNDVVNNKKGLKITTDSGYVTIGPENSTWSHFYTNRRKFYFNKGLDVDTGVIASYNEDLQLQTPTGNTRMTIDKDTGNVVLTGDISDSGGSVTVDDSLRVTGDQEVEGILRAVGPNIQIDVPDIFIGIRDALASTITLTGNVLVNLGDMTVSRGLDLRGALSNGVASSVSVNDGLTVSGNTNLNSSLAVTGNTTLNRDLTVRDNFTVNSANPEVAKDVTLNGNTFVKYNLDVRGNMRNLGGDAPLLVGDDLSVTGDTDIQGVIKNSLVEVLPIAIIDHGVTVDDDLAVTGALNVSGSILADRIGGYQRPVSAFKAMAPGASEEQTVACPADYNLLSCGAQASWTTPAYNWTKWVNINYVWSSIWNNTCIVRGTNTHTTANRYLAAVAVCWNPSSF